MGRRKIQIKAIDNQKSRVDTFHKRKIGLVKKAAELSMLCGVRMLLAFEDLSGEIFRYSTHGIFEPRDYFQEAWFKTTSSKTKKDYPDFFVKVSKKRKTKSNAKAENGEESGKSSESEIEIEDQQSNSSSMHSAASPAEQMNLSRNQSRGKVIGTDNILDALEGIDRHLSSWQLPSNGIIPNDTQVFLQSIKKSIDEIKRRPHNTVQLETTPLIVQDDQKNRRRTVATSRASIDKRLLPAFGNGLNSSGGSLTQFGKKGGFEVDPNDPRRPLMLRGDFNDVIFEESETGNPILNVSPINRDRGSVMDFMDDEYFKRAKPTNEYLNFTAQPYELNLTQVQVPEYGERNIELLKNPYMPNADNSRVLFPFGNFSRLVPNSNEPDKENSPGITHAENHSGTMLNGTQKDGQSKSDSDHSKSQIENSKLNAKDFWLNFSRLEGSALENSSLLKEEPILEPPSGILRFNNSRIAGLGGNYRGFGNEAENSGLLLFSPIPLTSMTAAKRSENPDWFSYTLKYHNELQHQKQQNPEQVGNSFQSDSSIMKSPKLKKHVKDA